jgi:hypothetical protein
MKAQTKSSALALSDEPFIAKLCRKRGKANPWPYAESITYEKMNKNT